MKTNINKIIMAMSLCLPGIGLAEAVDISDVMPSGGKTGEANPNIYLTLDDSGSMTAGVAYNPSITYQIPTDANGIPIKDISDLPTLPTVFKDPFINNTTTTRTCINTSDNCKIWANFYRDRMLTLKSSVAIAFNNPIVDKMRMGYQGINRGRNNILPVRELGNPTMKATFYNWLFNVYASGGTPLRSALNTEFTKVISASRNASSSLNPFLNTPGDLNSGLDYCRRNYNIHLSDGGWNGDNSINLGGNVDNTAVTFPDGTSYIPSLPYSDNNFNYVSDLTFEMWYTDLDNNSQTDDLEPFYPKVFNSDGTGPEVQALGGNTYWHPYNNPATWQHISTYGITVAMNPTLSINRPTTQAEAMSGIGITPGLLNGAVQFGANVAPNDIIHSALNGRGQYYNVFNSGDLIEAFNEIIKDIDKVSSVARGNAGAVSSNYKGQSNYVVTQYDPSDYSGNVLSYPLYNGNASNTTYVNSCFSDTTEIDLSIPNQVCDIPAWDAQSKLDDPVLKPYDSRKIYTTNSVWAGPVKTTSQSIFAPAGITTDQFNIFLAAAPDFTISLIPADIEQTANDMINYIRGDRSKEILDENGAAIPGGIFRTRGSALGDIGRSSVEVVSSPSLVSGHPLLSQTEYLQFYDDYKDREPIVYVSANDGMIHAFRSPNPASSNYNANKGDELFAYIPDIIIEKLPHLAEDGGSHQAYIDGKLNVQNVNFNITDWKTVLLAALGSGGKGFISLDVTDPIDYIANNTPVTRWEYGEKDSRKYTDGLSNIGNIMEAVSIFELQDNTWAAITGNGYNSESNRSVLIVVNLKTGETIQELEVPTGFSNDGPDGSANGLGPAYFISTDGDTIVDRAYAGDLQGNLWVFDLTNSSANGGITVVNDKPLFQAIAHEGQRQAITTYPVVVEHPTNIGYMVHFGTGALFDAIDFTANMTNSVYAIWDDWEPQVKTDSIQKFGDLREIKFEYEAASETTNGTPVYVRTIPADKPATTWANIGGNGSTNALTVNGEGPARGWFIDLTDPGAPYGLPSERVWQPAFITYGENDTTAISYITTKFNDVLEATCGENEVTSWLLAFNINDASRRLTGSTIDTDSDGNISSSDNIKDPGSTSSSIATSGLQLNGMLLAPNAIESLASTNVDEYGVVDNCDSTTTVIASADSDEIRTAKTCKSSYPSSWMEIKRSVPVIPTF